jgi:bifunctional pyridoxal-dependent enzyme with beta-cystathionase and maltose regulon repressor activities
MKQLIEKAQEVLNGMFQVGFSHYSIFNVREDDVLPMWVADSDFAVAPEITEALCARARQRIYGYTK